MLNKSPLLAVNSKSITSSSNPKNLIGSSPTIASWGSSSIPFFCSSVKNLASIPSSNKEHSIPFDSSPLITPFFIVTSPGSFAPGRATITFNPSLTFGAPQTMFNISFPTSTVHICRWSESGCILHVLTSPIISLLAFTSFSAESYSFPTLVISSAKVLTSTSIST